jgi:hypothetical protein
MNENDLPKDVLGRIEQRWASRLQRDARSWSTERPLLGTINKVADRSGGRTIPVTINSANAGSLSTGSPDLRTVRTLQR